VSQKEIAELVGLSRQRVNQVLKQLVRAGLIRVNYRSLTVLNLAGLRDFAAQPERWSSSS
jgi:DNA-binding GntR family transcriptional regulator